MQICGSNCQDLDPSSGSGAKNVREETEASYVCRLDSLHVKY